MCWKPTALKCLRTSCEVSARDLGADSRPCGRSIACPDSSGLSAGCQKHIEEVRQVEEQTTGGSAGRQCGDRGGGQRAGGKVYE